jgi:uncharacterized Zn finger protein
LPRGREKKLKCPRCGSEDVEIVKQWQLISPLPDRYGRITVTIMGIVKCKRCGYTWRTVISKIKVGGSGVEIEGKKVMSEEEPRRVKEIVLDLDELEEEEEEE